MAPGSSPRSTPPDPSSDPRFVASSEPLPDPSRDPPFPVEPAAKRTLERLWDGGHAAFLVGGAVRDALLGRATHDWDVATDALPERILELFPEGSYENRFGTVLADGIEITTFRRDHRYRDHRRPDEVTFTQDPVEDLSRRDFTVNAIAWGRGASSASSERPDSRRSPSPSPERPRSRRSSSPSPQRSAPPLALPDFLDPTGGRTDLESRILRAVGDPDARFEEDALRLLRGARISAEAGLQIEPLTLAAMTSHARDVTWVSGERIGIELRRMLGSPRPSDALRILAETGILESLFPELAAQRGVPQAKVTGHDLWEHTLATVDAMVVIAPSDERLAVAALFHDAGKPDTHADGHFLGHPEVGAGIAREVLGRIAYPSRDAAYVARLIEEHMFQYSPAWTDAAVRRFMRRAGTDHMDDLLRLREADNVGSGVPEEAGGLEELRARIEAERRRPAVLSLSQLAVDGNDVLVEVGRPPGPWVAVLLDRLLDSVVSDPARNTREALLSSARTWAAEDRSRATHERHADRPMAPERGPAADRPKAPERDPAADRAKAHRP